jgi:hypothetical protein
MTTYYLSSPRDFDADPTRSVEDMLLNLKERMEAGRRTTITWNDGKAHTVEIWPHRLPRAL